MEFAEVVRSRRSIRKFKHDPIPEDVLGRILEAGRTAPSGMNRQPWVFGVVSDPDLKQSLVAASGGQEWIAGAPVILCLCAVLDDDITTKPADDMWVRAYEARYGSAFMRHLLAFPDSDPVNLALAQADVIIAGQQMYLAAVAEGLGGCWIGYVDAAEVARRLNLPRGVVCVFMLPIGYPDETPEPVERKGLDEVVFRNRWTG